MPKNYHKAPLFSLRIPETTRYKLKYISACHKRSFTQEVSQLIVKHIARFEKEHGEIDFSDFEVLRRQ